MDKGQETLERIREDIESAVFDIVLKYQSELEITDGGLEPLLELELEDRLGEMTETIGRCLQWQLDWKD